MMSIERNVKVLTRYLDDRLKRNSIATSFFGNVEDDNHEKLIDLYLEKVNGSKTLYLNCFDLDNFGQSLSIRHWLFNRIFVFCYVFDHRYKNLSRKEEFRTEFMNIQQNYINQTYPIEDYKNRTQRQILHIMYQILCTYVENYIYKE